MDSLQLYFLHRFIGERQRGAVRVGRRALFAGYDIYGYLAAPTDSARVSASVRLRAAARTRLDRPGVAAGLGRPELDLGTRKLEWLASGSDGSRNYLLLRNAWDFNRVAAAAGLYA